MKEYLYIEEDTSSISLTLSQISDRDFAATEELVQGFANFLGMYCGYLNRDDDVAASTEKDFLMEYEKLLRSISSASAEVRKLILAENRKTE